MCKNLSFEECELAILRASIDSSEKREGAKLMKSPTTQTIINMIETFIKKTKSIVYGGTAVNNILSSKTQFYDYDYEIPDYDFFSKEPLKHAKELADFFSKKGFEDVEAKSGVHHGTYKVFVNQMGVADITYLHPELYKTISKDAIKKNGILYAPANFLRQSMYLELSRPMGDVSRWEKVLKRLNLLNKEYPLVYKKCELQRGFSSRNEEEHIFKLAKHAFVTENVVFIGGYANALYTTHSNVPILKNIPDFDVLSVNPKKTAEKIKSVLERANYKVIIKEHPPIGELVSTHYSVSVNNDYIAFIYEPIACHSYNVIHDGTHDLKIGTIDTLLSYYLAFMYADRDYYDVNRLLCLSSLLFKVQQENRLAQKGLLKRFSIQCYGKQKSLKSIREEKNQLREKLKPGMKEYEEYFLKYVPKTRKRKTGLKTKRVFNPK
jgi:hypothetical protein